MRALAKHFHEDEKLWGIAGLLHDGDYEKTKDSPERHTLEMANWLKEKGVNDQELLDVILSHNYAHFDRRSLRLAEASGETQVGEGGYGHTPKNNLEWSLYCCDELSGLIVAVALVKDKKLASVSVESVMKKFPIAHFAAGVNREQIKMCREKLGINLEEFIAIALSAMQKISADLHL